MKAFLLAAGHGTRLRPLTDSTPKCLLPIGGTPLLGIWLDLCSRSGISQVSLNISAHAGLVREYVREYTAQHPKGVEVRLFEEPKLLGSAGTLAANRHWVRSEACFWVLYADVLTNTDLPAMLRFHRAHPSAATVGVYFVPDPSRCGIVSVDSNSRVTQFIEKPSQPASNLAFSGVLIATSELLERIPDKSPSDLGHDVLPQLAGRMSAYEIEDFLLDIGTPQNYERAQATWPGLEKSGDAETQRHKKEDPTCSPA